MASRLPPRGASASDATNLMSAIRYRGLRLTGASYRTLIGLLRDGALGLGGWQVRSSDCGTARALVELAGRPRRNFQEFLS